MAKPMPAIFFGHGNPMNALTHNAWTRGVDGYRQQYSEAESNTLRLGALVPAGDLVTATSNRARFTTSAAFRANCMRSSIRRRATRSLRIALRICSRHSWSG